MAKGVTKEADGRRREVVLFTDQVGRQTVRMRFRTTEQEEHARNKGLSVFTGQRPGASVWRGEHMARPRDTEHSEMALALEKKDGKVQGGAKYQGGKTVTEIFRETSKSNRYI